MRFSSIDIGTNTILLLIADADDTGIVRVVHDEQVIARLGQGVDEQRVISDEARSRVVQFLRDYGETSRTFKAEKIIAVGTSALRDARNKEEFCEAVLRETGIAIETLSGDDEAEWTYRGAIGDQEEINGEFTVLDIGGGSTEIIIGRGGMVVDKWSLDIGSVRITERFLRTSPPTSLEISGARTFLQEHLGEIDFSAMGESRFVGVAGTVTTLAALRLRLPRYDREKVHGYVLVYDAIREVFNQLRIKTVEEIRRIPQISHGRADIILAGIFILLEIMETGNIPEIIVSDRGLRYGMVMREVERWRAGH